MIMKGFTGINTSKTNKMSTTINTRKHQPQVEIRNQAKDHHSKTIFIKPNKFSILLHYLLPDSHWKSKNNWELRNDITSMWNSSMFLSQIQIFWTWHSPHKLIFVPKPDELKTQMPLSSNIKFPKNLINCLLYLVVNLKWRAHSIILYTMKC